MKRNFVEVNGKPIQPGTTFTVDHTEQVFTIKVRSLSGVGAESLKDHIESKWEVVQIEEVEKTHFVKR